MAVRIGCGLSTGPDPREAAIAAAAAARDGLDGRDADAVAVFCAGRHLDDPGPTLDVVGAQLAPTALVGCGAGGVLGGGREVEGGTGIAVWAAALDGGRAEAFWAETVEAPGGVSVTGLPALEGAAAVTPLPD